MHLIVGLLTGFVAQQLWSMGYHISSIAVLVAGCITAGMIIESRHHR